MLRYMRENTGNWLIKIVLGIIVVVFVFLGMGSFGSKRNNSVATINDEPITIKEFQRTYKTIMEQMRARFGKNLNDDLLKALNIKQQALNSLIEEKLMLAQADKLDIIVSDKELQNSLLSIKAFQKGGVFNLGRYKKVLRLNSLDPEIFEQNQINKIKQQKLRSMVLSGITVADLEAREWYLLQNTKIAVDYLLFAPDDYSDIQPDQKEIKKFYDENREQYKSKLKRTALYLEFSPEDYKDKVKIDKTNIKDYYEQHKEKLKTPPKVEARHILIKLASDAAAEEIKAAEKKALDIYNLAKNGEDFQKLAKEYSQGPSKQEGGYLGVFGKKEMVKPFADKAFSMKTGEISKPVRTRFGLHIINVMDRIQASIKTLEQASETIKKELAEQQMENFAYDKSGQAFDAVIDGDDFEQVALIADKKILKTKAFSIEGQEIDIINNREFAQAAFELPMNNISDIKQFGKNYYLIKVISKKEPVIQKFDTVKDKIAKQLKERLQKESARKDAKLYIAKTVEEQSLDHAAQASGLKINSTKLFTRNSSIEGVGNSPEFSQASFSLNKDNTIYPELVQTDAGYYIIGFKEKKMPEESEISKNLQKTKKSITAKKQNQYYQAWVAELKKQSEINFDPKILD